MRRKIVDKVATLEERANEGLDGIDSFIYELESAQDDAATLDVEAQSEVDRLKAVQKKCGRVEKFTTALLKLAK